jgi:hypothetical protein
LRELYWSVCIKKKYIWFAIQRTIFLAWDYFLELDENVSAKKIKSGNAVYSN